MEKSYDPSSYSTSSEQSDKKSTGTSRFIPEKSAAQRNLSRSSTMNLKDSASSSMTKRPLEDLYEGDDTERKRTKGIDDSTHEKSATAAEDHQPSFPNDIHILTTMRVYCDENNKAYPYDTADKLSDFVKNWLNSNADPVEVGQRIQELLEMYLKSLDGKPVYSDSPDDVLRRRLSKKLWHYQFGYPDD